MKRNNIISKVKRSLMVFFGLLAAVLLFVQEPISNYLVQEQEQLEMDVNSDNNTDEQSPEQSFKVLSYEVLVPVMNFNLFHSFDLLIELPSLENKGTSVVQNTVLLFDSFFDKLFTRIIAPNAP